jgi:ribose/xylose/arabinose/galactoside ABC-type transport system permease subunit
MKDKLLAFIQKNRQFIPLSATALLAIIAYSVGASLYPGMRNPQVFFNIFRNNSFLLVSAVGMTLVILSGGIDLSVSGMIALTTVITAALLREGWNAWLVILLVIGVGMSLGAVMGCFIAYLKAQPWIATLAGMWFTRGMCFFISDDAISISNRTFDLLSRTRIFIPGLTEFFEAQGRVPPYISIPVVASFVIFFAGIILSKYTRFGRNIYAIGGNEGRNEQSARLMGLPVDKTKVLVYTLNGFCSAVAGVLYSMFVTSGHGLYADGFEMDVIASVVMGGTMLSGGTGYVFGTLFGAFIFGLTQTLIQFIGTLSSWWTKIVIGILTLIFIGVQSLLNQSKGGIKKEGQLTGEALKKYKRKRQLTTFGTVTVVVVLILAWIFLPQLRDRAGIAPTPQASKCEIQPYRQDQAAELIDEGAIIVYERNGGPECIDELYAFYPDGKIVGDNNEETIEKQITATDLNLLMGGIIDNGWFTDELYDTWHTPCGQCYGYYLTVVHEDQEKTVKGVDGGTDAPSLYWQVISLVKGAVPKFDISE